jgi:formylglycine-generating enzyme required for sulfatase activity
MKLDRGNILIFTVIFSMIFMFNAKVSHSGGMLRSFISKDNVRMKQVPGGTFIMGSEEPDLAQIAPVHKVYLKTFFIDEHPVTNRHFAEFLNSMRPAEKENTGGQEQVDAEGVPDGDVAPSDGKVPERFKWVALRSDLDIEGRKGWWPTEILYERGNYVALEGFEDYPVVSVSYEAAAKYCNWVGKRLPTEAEWEKAARGGLRQKKFSWGDALPTEGIVFNRQWTDNQSPVPLENVKIYLPNGYGLYNMSGMVWEWCSDWFDPFYYKNSPKKNPTGPESGNLKVLRGGSWFNAANALRVALRNFIVPQALDETTGFRCVTDFPGEHNVKK